MTDRVNVSPRRPGNRRRPARGRRFDLGRAALGGGIVLLLAGGLIALREPVGVELLLRATEGGSAPRLCIPLTPGEQFTLHYNHSVTGAPIWEVHSVDASGRIFIEEERFAALGAGMGHWPGHGELGMRGAHQVIADIHVPIDEFMLRIGGPAVDHTLIVREQQIRLAELIPEGRVQIVARPIRRLQRLWERWVALPVPGLREC